MKDRQNSYSKTVCRVAVFCIALMAAACSKDESPTPEPTPEPHHDLPMGRAYVTDSSFHESQGMTVYNFAYPSVDPFGDSIMLSGAITLGRDVSRQTTAKGFILWNRQTIFRADQCPSRGELSTQKLMLGYGLITVSPDQYGFGATEGHHQAYCLSRYNARTSLDAFQAAKELLSQLGYRWGDLLFNAGYSQGGQTAMAVVRQVAEEHPELDITYTFAGAGPYDLPLTYRHFVGTNTAVMPCSLISVILAYNEFMNIDAEPWQLFQQPTQGNINAWFHSKRFTNQEIDLLVGTSHVSDILTPALLDTSSTLAAAFLQALDSDNLCHGWTPRGTEHIMLFHGTLDNAVPSANSQRLYDFLSSHGVQDVDLQLRDIEPTTTSGAHENGALTFGLLAIQKLRLLLAESE